MKRSDIVTFVAMILGVALFGLAVINIHSTHPLHYSRNLLAELPRRYPESHWRRKIANSCMNCGHTSFITKHWDKDELYCENCKKVHKGKLSTHYMYDDVLTCMSCGHEEVIPKVHNDTHINCNKCKMGHYDHYITKSDEKALDNSE